MFSLTVLCRTIHDNEQVPLLCQGNSLFGPYPQHCWYEATTFQSSYETDETPQNATKKEHFLALLVTTTSSLRILLN